MYTELQCEKIEDVIKKYGGMVKQIAYHMMLRLPDTVQIEDIIQTGMIGLMEAAKNYNPDKGAKFETYASIRIRGTIIDELRKEDWIPRSVYKNARMVADAIKVLENKYGKDVKDTDVCKYLNISLSEYHKILLNSNGTRLFSIDELGVTGEYISDNLRDDREEPFSEAEKSEFKKELAQNIAELPERERVLLELYYDKELNLKEIGQVLNVSESRVCQLHSQAMLRLKSRMQEWQE